MSDGNLLGRLHHRHRSLDVLGTNGSESEATIRVHDGRHAVLARVGAVGIPEECGVVVGVLGDVTRGDDSAGRIDPSIGLAVVEAADLGDASISNPDVRVVARGPVPSTTNPPVINRSKGWLATSDSSGTFEFLARPDDSVLYERAASLSSAVMREAVLDNFIWEAISTELSELGVVGPEGQRCQCWYHIGINLTLPVPRVDEVCRRRLQPFC